MVYLWYIYPIFIVYLSYVKGKERYGWEFNSCEIVFCCIFMSNKMFCFTLLWRVVFLLFLIL